MIGKQLQGGHQLSLPGALDVQAEEVLNAKVDIRVLHSGPVGFHQASARYSSPLPLLAWRYCLCRRLAALVDVVPTLRVSCIHLQPEVGQDLVSGTLNLLQGEQVSVVSIVVIGSELICAGLILDPLAGAEESALYQKRTCKKKYCTICVIF